MCGIAGFRSVIGTVPDGIANLGLRMAKAMRQRGPNHQGVWVDDAAGLVLAHARLSIIDLREVANQPFVSADGKAAIVYNGEVYNFRQLRDELRLAGIEFRSDSDTEVVLQSCRHWGVLEAARRLVGMFAFAYWDVNDRRLSLVRDPVGIKPIYYGQQAGTFLFSSTLAAFQHHPDFQRQISPDALAAYFRFSYVPGPLSIFSGVHKLQPGHALFVEDEGNQVLHCYWDAHAKARRGLVEPFDGSLGETTDAFERLLRDSVRGCLISDVPIGAFLSGGIDSSLVAAVMQGESSRCAQTFTVGFSDARYDESGYARQVATCLGCDHTEIICSTADACALIADIPDCYDEPFADSSQIPTMLLSKLTRQRVTVALSGDGGDELFGGYDRYYWMERLRRLLNCSPTSLQNLLTRMAKRFPREVLFPVLYRLPRGETAVSIADGWYHLARMIEYGDDYGYLYRTTPMSVCAIRDNQLLSQEMEPPSILENQIIRSEISDIVSWMQFVDQQSYLPDDILQKVDRASMAYSLEARVPLLDHRILEFSWRVPMRYKLHRGRGKIIMRELLARYLPKQLIERPKRGFSIPLSDWLKGDLRDWAESLVGSTAAVNDPLLNHAGVSQVWGNFLTGRAEHTLATVWNLLMYLSWRKRYV